jgi:hypothetical protein
MGLHQLPQLYHFKHGYLGYYLELAWYLRMRMRTNSRLIPGAQLIFPIPCFLQKHNLSYDRTSFSVVPTLNYELPQL